MSLNLGRLHHRFVFLRRVTALVRAISPLVEPGEVLDLGSGNGMIGQKIMSQRPDVSIIGADVLIRPQTLIPTVAFDGIHLPFPDKAFSTVIIVDVLHHTPDMAVVLAEASRVGRSIIVKDHFYENRLEFLMLKALDWFGNAAHGVALPYNYFTRAQWESTLHDLSLGESHRREAVAGLYPQPAQSFLGRRIQFVAKLEST